MTDYDRMIFLTLCNPRFQLWYSQVCTTKHIKEMWWLIQSSIICQGVWDRSWPKIVTNSHWHCAGTVFKFELEECRKVLSWLRFLFSVYMISASLILSNIWKKVRKKWQYSLQLELIQWRSKSLTAINGCQLSKCDH